MANQTRVGTVGLSSRYHGNYYATDIDKLRSVPPTLPLSTVDCFQSRIAAILPILSHRIFSILRHSNTLPVVTTSYFENFTSAKRSPCSVNGTASLCSWCFYFPGNRCAGAPRAFLSAFGINVSLNNKCYYYFLTATFPRLNATYTRSFD